MQTVKITLSGQGGELASKLATAASIKQTLLELIEESEIAEGDTITITAID